MSWLTQTDASESKDVKVVAAQAVDALAGVPSPRD